MEILDNVDFFILMFCALLGSVKASIEVDRGQYKPIAAKGVDVILGVVVGMALVNHFANELSLGLSIMVATAGGASGAMMVEVFLQVVPSLAKNIIVRAVKRLLG